MYKSNLMKRRSITYYLFLSAVFFTTMTVKAQSQERISTPWAVNMKAANPLPEYPRPKMVRSNWVNLNGSWNYAIQPKSNEVMPASFESKIIVPFAVESALSGVTKTVGKDSVLWYNRTFSVPANARNQNVLLHFGAVDWLCDVYVNGKKAGTHQGGFDPFTFNISSFLTKDKLQQLTVRVWDPTDDGPQPRGKQVKNPRGIWYTPVTGIWQTVWMEAVPQTYIASFRQTPDVDNSTITLSGSIENILPSDMVKYTVYDGEKTVAEKDAAGNADAAIRLDSLKTWSPENPFLYKLKMAVVRNGKTVDEVKSYFAMRKISLQADSKGVQRMMLNNRFVFQYGPLDQGWWPDGLYTAPTDEALRFDIEKTKEMGFNMIRKHTKTESARWYYYCDSIGILVWQDMPTGDLGGGRWENRPGIENSGADRTRTPESEKIYRTEWTAIMDNLYNYQCIVVWVPFNEAWGQFKTVEITNWTMQHDRSRLVNSASGGNFFMAGDIIDLHSYPAPAMPSPELFGAKRALVVGEFGGLGMPMKGHVWQENNNWGYRNFGNADSLFTIYTSFVQKLKYLIPIGLSAAVYTQTTDVEGEVNGFMTYDRKVMKFPVNKLREVNSQLYDKTLISQFTTSR